MADIVLVHGAWHGPWCWANFETDLAARGHAITVVQLRGHDGSRRRLWGRIKDYVEDVRRAAAALTAPPVLVGHSMGALVVQKYLESGSALGAVLMASVPTGGTRGAAVRLGLRNPGDWAMATALFRLMPVVRSSERVRTLFFTPETPQPIVDHCFAHIQDESYLAFLETMFVLARPDRIQTPVLVMGGERDAIFTVDEVRATARAFGAEPQIVPAMGHNMMLDENWREAAGRIHAWVAAQERVHAGG